MTTDQMLPNTSPGRYLSGIAALNLPTSPFTGDWHFYEIFSRINENKSRTFIAGDGCATNTNPYLGYEGVVECRDVIQSLNIPAPEGCFYAANHARAIMDLVLAAIFNNESPEFVILDDYMDRDSDKDLVYELGRIATTSLAGHHLRELQKWLAENSI